MDVVFGFVPENVSYQNQTKFEEIFDRSMEEQRHFRKVLIYYWTTFRKPVDF